jgi:hypothetical protein
VYSQFALKQFARGKRTLKCPAGTPWTWCLNKPCTVDPANPNKAICGCDVLRSGEWITAGGNCNVTTCKTSYWSGAPLSDFKDGTDFLVKQLKLKKSPVNWCSSADGFACTARGRIDFRAFFRDPKFSHAEALRQSMLAMIDAARSDHDADPRLWAAIVVVGELAKPQRRKGGLLELHRDRAVRCCVFRTARSPRKSVLTTALRR